jgi:predicted transcriptional regulator of viral defense system
MVHDQRSALSSYVARQLAQGRIVFTREEAAQELGISRGAFLDAAERLQKRKSLISPRHGFYVIVAPQFASWEAPPPSWYLDALMRHENEPYYVGLLKAAELHGASHQAVMEFQVVTAKRLPKIRAGRSRIVFYFRKDMEEVAAGLEDSKTDTGTMKISSPALTALDLARYPQATAGLDNVVTVLADLVPKIDADQLAVLSSSFEKPVVQRLGYLLQWLGHGELVAPLWQSLIGRGPFGWVELDRRQAKDPDFAPAPLEKNPQWRVTVRRHPERDE